jgi:hypothetical protein
VTDIFIQDQRKPAWSCSFSTKSGNSEREFLEEKLKDLEKNTKILKFQDLKTGADILQNPMK